MDSKDYKTSTNYDLLVDLLNQQKRVVCFADYDPNHGFKSELKENEMRYEAGARGN